MSVSFSQIRNLVVVAAVGFSLAGCASGAGGLRLPGTSTASNSASSTPGVQQSASDVANAGSIVDDTTRLVLSNPKKLTGYCPSVSVLDETNIYQSFAKGGEGNAQMLVHQASITQTARECTTLGAEMYIKVGVAGRVLGGPKSGDSSKAVLPLRIVVKQGDDVLYTQMHKIPVQLTPPDRSALFARVDEGIAIPTPAVRNVQILVGFDASSGRR